MTAQIIQTRKSGLFIFFSFIDFPTSKRKIQSPPVRIRAAITLTKIPLLFTQWTTLTVVKNQLLFFFDIRFHTKPFDQKPRCGDHFQPPQLSCLGPSARDEFLITAPVLSRSRTHLIPRLFFIWPLWDCATGRTRTCFLPLCRSFFNSIVIAFSGPSRSLPCLSTCCRERSEMAATALSVLRFPSSLPQY